MKRVFVAALTVYLCTLADGLQGGDAGELAVSASRFAVAHPPGYPVYVALGKLASLWPWGSLATKLNVLAALCMAGAAALLARAAGVLAGLVFAFAPLAWSWGTQLEVFSLHALFCAALLVCFRERRDGWFGFLFGLGLGNHQTLLLLGLPLFPWSRRALGTFAAGLSVYLLLPLMSPGWGDVRTWAGFFRHVTRADYGTFQLTSRTVSPWDGIFAMCRALWPFFAVALLGLKERRVAFALFLSAIAFHLLARFPVDTPLLESVLARFWIMPLLLACYLIGHARLPVFAWVAVPALLVLGWRSPQPSLVEPYGRALLEGLPPNGVLLTRGDLVHNAALYAHETGVRTDTLVIDQELMTYRWYVARQPLSFPGERYGDFNLEQLTRANPTRPFFVAGGVKPGDPSQIPEARLPVFDVRAATDDPWLQVVRQEVFAARERRGLQCLKSGEAKEATQIFRALADAHPHYATYKNLGIAHGMLGDRDAEREAYRRYLELAPKHDPDRANITQIVNRSW